jgi:hypothetical protein
MRANNFFKNSGDFQIAKMQSGHELVCRISKKPGKPQCPTLSVELIKPPCRRHGQRPVYS